MDSKRQALSHFKLYAVTDLKTCTHAVLDTIEEALRGGVDILQLRSKVLTDRELYGIGKDIKKLTEKYAKLFFINDRPDLALAVGADGIHIGQDDLPVSVVRKLFTAQAKDVFIGKSTHSLEQAIAAEREGVDYIGLGPVFATPTKENYEPVGLRLIHTVMQRISVPCVCIGGINQDNVEEVLGAGAERIAVVRALFSAPDIYRAAQLLKEKVNHYGKCKKI